MSELAAPGEASLQQDLHEHRRGPGVSGRRAVRWCERGERQAAAARKLFGKRRSSDVHINKFFIGTQDGSSYYPLSSTYDYIEIPTYLKIITDSSQSPGVRACVRCRVVVVARACGAWRTFCACARGSGRAWCVQRLRCCCCSGGSVEGRMASRGMVSRQCRRPSQLSRARCLGIGARADGVRLMSRRGSLRREALDVGAAGRD